MRTVRKKEWEEQDVGGRRFGEIKSGRSKEWEEPGVGGTKGVEGTDVGGTYVSWENKECEN